jgi:proline iminopeptidase
LAPHERRHRQRALLFAGLLTGLTPPSAFAQAPAEEQPIHVVEVGSGPATVIVLHGGPGFAHQYLRPEWDALGRHYRVVYYDQRGCGRSTRRGPYGWEQHVTDLHTLVLRYKANGPVVLAGSSWGSWLALLYAWDHPHQAAALVLSGVPPWPIRTQQRLNRPSRPLAPYSRDSLPQEVRERRDAMEAARRAYQEVMEAWMRARQDSMEAGLLPQPTWDSASSVRYAINLDRRLARRLGEGCPAARAGVYASFRYGPSLADLRSITLPVLIVRGTRPNLVDDGSAALLQTLGNGQLVTLMGAGHDPWFERPTQFFAHVERFLQRSVFALTT